MSQASTIPYTISFAEFLASRGDVVPLDRAMVWMSVEEYPKLVDPTEMLVWLDELAAGVCMPPRCEAYEAVARINYHLFHELGFVGDAEEYDDPQNSCLATVLTRKRGLPIVLSAIYMEVARRCGVTIEGIGFPGHFFVSPVVEGPRFFLDAFGRGRILSESDLLGRLDLLAGRPVPRSEALRFLEPVSHHSMLIRMNCNLKRSYLNRKNWGGALRCIDRILALAPGNPDNIRDRGLVLAQLERVEEAIESFESYLRARPGAPDVDAIRRQLRAMRQRSHAAVRD